MKKLFRTFFMFTVLTTFIVQSAGAVDAEVRNMYGGARWENIYDYFQLKDVNQLSSIDKQLFIMAAHLSNHNQIAFEMREKLTEADFIVMPVWGNMTRPSPITQNFLKPIRKARWHSFCAAGPFCR